VLTLHGVTKRFGDLVAVDQLSLEVRAGEVFGLLGPNGAGKSTTVHMAVGLLHPDAGLVNVAGLGSPDRPEARRQLGVAPQALAILPTGFGTASQRMFYGEPPKLRLAVDPSRRAEASMLEGLLMGAAMQGFERLFTDTEYSRSIVDGALADLEREPATGVTGRGELERFLGELKGFLGSPAMGGGSQADGAGGGAGPGWRPLVVEKADVAVERTGPRNAFMVTFPQGALWGVIGCAFGFALSLVIERTRGTLTRLHMSPLSPGQVLAGKGLACFLSILVMETLLFGVARLFLGMVPGSVALLAAAGVCTAIGFVGIMMMISVLGRTEQTVGGLAWAVLLPMAMFGGGMVPLFVMPAWMRTASNLSPVKWGILAMEGALWRGFTWREMFLPCAILIGVGVIGFGFAGLQPAVGTRTPPPLAASPRRHPADAPYRILVARALVPAAHICPPGLVYIARSTTICAGSLPSDSTITPNRFPAAWGKSLPTATLVREFASSVITCSSGGPSSTTRVTRACPANGEVLAIST
jgi:ABC-2 type transport system permease protein